MRVITQFVICWNRADNKAELCDARPTAAGNAVTVMAAIVHALTARHDHATTPEWVHDHVSSTPISISETDLDIAYGQHIKDNTPEAARAHNVWFHKELLDR